MPFVDPMHRHHYSGIYHPTRAKDFQIGVCMASIMKYDLTGKVFGDLRVMRRVPSDKRGIVMWDCKCRCGNRHRAISGNIRSGRAKSCGCRQLLGIGDWNKNKYRSHFGKYIDNYGYVKIKCRCHPNSKKNGYVSEHVFIMSKCLNRAIGKGESIHHKNGIRDDNRIANLELWDNSHPSGQRISDKVEFYYDYLKTHAPHLIRTEN